MGTDECISTSLGKRRRSETTCFDLPTRSKKLHKSTVRTSQRWISSRPPRPKTRPVYTLPQDLQSQIDLQHTPSLISIPQSPQHRAQTTTVPSVSRELQPFVTIARTHLLLFLVYRRNKNQHHSQPFFKPLSILRRRLSQLLSLYESFSNLENALVKMAHANAEETRLRFARQAELRRLIEIHKEMIRETLVPECYTKFSNLVSDPQFANIGVVLIGILAEVSGAVGFPSERLISSRDLKNASLGRSRSHEAPSFAKGGLGSTLLQNPLDVGGTSQDAEGFHDRVSEESSVVIIDETEDYGVAIARDTFGQERATRDDLASNYTTPTSNEAYVQQKHPSRPGTFRSDRSGRKSNLAESRLTRNVDLASPFGIQSKSKPLKHFRVLDDPADIDTNISSDSRVYKTNRGTQLATSEAAHEHTATQIPQPSTTQTAEHDLLTTGTTTKAAPRPMVSLGTKEKEKVKKPAKKGKKKNAIDDIFGGFG